MSRATGHGGSAEQDKGKTGIPVGDRTVYLSPDITWGWLQEICTEPVRRQGDGAVYMDRFERVVSHPFHILMGDGTTVTAEPHDRIAEYDRFNLTFGDKVKLIRTHLLCGTLPTEELEQVDESVIEMLEAGHRCPRVGMESEDLPDGMRVVIDRADTLGALFDMPDTGDAEFEEVILSRWPARGEWMEAHGIVVTDGFAEARRS